MILEELEEGEELQEVKEGEEVKEVKEREVPKERDEKERFLASTRSGLGVTLRRGVTVRRRNVERTRARRRGGRSGR